MPNTSLLKNRTLKLIWDFKGEDGEHIAKHHVIHIDEFAIKENIPLLSSGVEQLNANHHIAFLVLKEENMIAVRDALKPHRGELVEE